MVYAIEEMKIAAAGFAACGGTYGKGKREKAVLPPGGQAQGDVYAYADHLCELCHRDRAGHLSAQPACCQQAWAAGCTGCHVHRHKRYLRYWSDRAGYLDPVHLLWAGGDPAAHSGGWSGVGHPHQLLRAGYAAAYGIPRSAAAGRKRLSGRICAGQGRAEDRGGTGWPV